MRQTQIENFVRSNANRIAILEAKVLELEKIARYEPRHEPSKLQVKMKNAKENETPQKSVKVGGDSGAVALDKDGKAMGLVMAGSGSGSGSTTVNVKEVKEDAGGSE